MPQAKAKIKKTGGEVKHLYRSRVERMIGGVCGGVAEYFSVDTTLIRVLWVLSIFVNGLGFVAYIAALIIVPDNPSQEPVSKEESKQPENSMIILGIGIIVVGLIFLFGLNRYEFHFMWPFSRRWFLGWDLFWPIAIIALGGLWIAHVLKKEKAVVSGASSRVRPGTVRRLTRSTTDRMIGGVCAGLARYLSIDTAFVRIGWVILTLFTEVLFGVIVYVAMLLAVPQDE